MEAGPREWGGPGAPRWPRVHSSWWPTHCPAPPPGPRLTHRTPRLWVFRSGPSRVRRNLRGGVGRAWAGPSVHVTRVGGAEPEPLPAAGAAMRARGLSCCAVLLVLGLCCVHSRNVLLMVGECRRPRHPSCCGIHTKCVRPSRFCPARSGPALLHLSSEQQGNPWAPAPYAELGGSLTPEKLPKERLASVRVPESLQDVPAQPPPHPCWPKGAALHGPPKLPQPLLETSNPSSILETSCLDNSVLLRSGPGPGPHFLINSWCQGRPVG